MQNLHILTILLPGKCVLNSRKDFVYLHRLLRCGRIILSSEGAIIFAMYMCTVACLLKRKVSIKFQVGNLLLRSKWDE